MNTNYKSVPVSPSEITPKHVYLSRRQFIKATGLIAGSAILATAGSAILAACAPSAADMPAATPTGTTAAADSTMKDELGDPVNSFKDITNYNNYYEFSTDKLNVAVLSKNFKTSPWEVEVYGMVNKPGKYSVDDLVKMFPPEDRIYRLRCVEAWSMVIPWQGFPLSSLLNEVEPTGSAKYVRFETITAPDQMPGERQPFYPWPYNEGLRMDEAVHPLTILATGMYGGELPAQNGGGIRLVVPWKYGFKSIKAIVKIELVDKQPATLWSSVAPDEYGFYSNVNPEVDHPRWSQATERRIGELKRRPTLMFNGYADQVAHLYDGMDLRANY